jgi:xylan 1,4-beta-xylosidase
LSLAGSGSSPTDGAPLTCIVGDRAYEAEVSVDLDEATEGGLLLFYNHRAYVGVGADGRSLKTYTPAEEARWMRRDLAARSVRFRVTNDEQVITFHYSTDEGRSWALDGLRMEVSGYNHKTFGGFLALRVGLYAAGTGSVRFRDFRYRALAD